jgi:hypothetical protein
VPTAETSPVPWRYTTEKPAADWFKSDFEADGWKEGPAGFGTKGTPGAVVRTVWKTDEISLRREIELPDQKLVNPCLFMHHDEDAEVYINGVFTAQAPDFTTEYGAVEIQPAARAALKPGKNIFAVHCHQTAGGQYIDVGPMDSVPGAASAARKVPTFGR